MRLEKTLPLDWKLSPLGDLASFSQGIQVGTEMHVSEPKEGYQRFIRIIDYTQPDNTDIRYVPIQGERYVAKATDIIMIRYGTPGVIGRGIEGIIANNMFKITFNNLILNDFAEQYFMFPETLKKLSDGSASSTMPAINFGFLKKLPVVVPPLPEQQKIAEILSTVDAKIEVIDQQITETQELKKGLMQQLLTKGIGHTKFKESPLGEIPSSWEVVPIYELRNKKDRYSFTGGPFGSDLKSEHYTESGVQVIQLQNIGEGEFINKSQIYTSEKKADELRSCNIYPDDIIMAKMAPVARSCKIPSFSSRFVMGSDGIRLAVDRTKYNNEFVFQALNANYFRKEAEAKSTGSTRARIGLNHLKLIPILIPNSLDEQQTIADILDSADSKLAILHEKKTNYKKLKQGLMQQLLTGKVRVKITAEA